MTKSSRMRESPLNSSKKSAKRIAQPYTDSLNAGRYNRPVAGLAILVQPIPADQAEGIYCWEGYGSRVLYEYPVFKIYEGYEDALQKSDNPFDLAHYAGMQAWKQRSDDVRKLDYMKILLAELNKRGWSHEEKMALLWFIEGVMHIEDEIIWNDGGQVHAA